MSIESGLYQFISTNSTFIAAAPGGLHPLALPEYVTQANGLIQPSATYQIVSAISDYSTTGPTGMVTARVQFDSWASSYAAAKAVADAIRTGIDGYAGTLPNGVSVQFVWRDNVTDSFNSDARLYRVQTDYRVVYAQT